MYIYTYIYIKYIHIFTQVYRYENATHCSASMGTTQGLMLVAKFLAVKGPRGTYSHCCSCMLYVCMFVCLFTWGMCVVFICLLTCVGRGIAGGRTIEPHGQTHIHVRTSASRDVNSKVHPRIYLGHFYYLQPRPPPPHIPHIKNPKPSRLDLSREAHLLNVPRAPVVHQHEAEEAVVGLGHRQGLACVEGGWWLGGGVSGRRYVIPTIAVTRHDVQNNNSFCSVRDCTHRGDLAARRRRRPPPARSPGGGRARARSPSSAVVVVVVVAGGV